MTADDDRSSGVINAHGPRRKMRRLSIAGRPLALAVSAALIGGLTAGTALATTRPTAGRHATATSVTAVAWHRLALRNGWRSARSPVYDVANPSYAVSGGIVYLDGSLHQVSGAKTEFAILPRTARPARTVYLTVFSGTAAGVPGTVEIRPNGVMTASSPAGSSPAADFARGGLLSGRRRPLDHDDAQDRLAVGSGRIPHEQPCLYGQECDRVPGWLTVRQRQQPDVCKARQERASGQHSVHLGVQQWRRGRGRRDLSERRDRVLRAPRRMLRPRSTECRSRQRARTCGGTS